MCVFRNVYVCIISKASVLVECVGLACDSRSSERWVRSGAVAVAWLSTGLCCGLSLVVHLAEVFDKAFQLRVSPKLPDEAVGLHFQVPQSLTGVGKRAYLLQVVHTVSFDVHVLCALPQDVLHLGALRTRPYGMNGGKRELALGQVLTEALILAVLMRAEVGVVVADLEEEAQRVQEGFQVLFPIREELHQAHGQAKEPSSFLQHHVAILLLCGTGVGVPPVDVQALTTVQLQQLLGKHLDSLRVIQGQHLLQPQKVDVVGRVDDGGNAIDAVGHGEASPQLGAVLDVVYEQAGVVQHLCHCDNHLQFVVWNIEPVVKCLGQFCPHLLS